MMRRVLILALLAGAVLLALGGCGAVTEELVVRGVTRELSASLKLDDSQRDVLRERVGHHLHMVRTNELSQMLELMLRTRAVIWRGADDASLHSLQLEVDALVNRAVQRFLPDSAALLATLEPHQVDRLRDDLLHRVDEAFAELELPVEERRRRAEERIIAGFEEFTGELRDEQRAVVLAVARELPDDDALHRDALTRRISLLTELLASGASADEVEMLLAELWRQRDEIPGASRDAATRRADERRLLLTLDSSLSSEQRSSAVARMDRRIARMERLQVR